jgi:hypothetical protein
LLILNKEFTSNEILTNLQATLYGWIYNKCNMDVSTCQVIWMDLQAILSATLYGWIYNKCNMDVSTCQVIWMDLQAILYG